jgi:hypothetical protein
MRVEYDGINVKIVLENCEDITKIVIAITAYNNVTPYKGGCKISCNILERIEDILIQ